MGGGGEGERQGEQEKGKLESSHDMMNDDFQQQGGL